MNITKIKDAAISSEVRQIRHNFTDEELSVLRDNFTEIEFKKADEEDALAEVSSSYKTRIKKFKDQNKKAMKLIRSRFIDRDVDVYLVPNFETSMMEFYDKTTGELVDERRLRPDEKQMNIITAKAV